MKRHFSLKQNSDFQRLYRKGKYAATSTLVLYWRPNRLGYSRLGITASTKLGHAVVRNKIRRQVDYWKLDRDFQKLSKKLGIRTQPPKETVQ